MPTSPATLPEPSDGIMPQTDINYYQTFITVAPDSQAVAGTVPPPRGKAKTKAQLQYELISDQPYQLTQEDVLFQVEVLHKQLPLRFGGSAWKKAKAEFFSKPQACLRASPLPKQYGWGLHFDEKGHVALVAKESPRYAELTSGLNGKLTIRPAMRSKRESK